MAPGVATPSLRVARDVEDFNLTLPDGLTLEGFVNRDRLEVFRGSLQIGDLEVECHVLDDFRRVFTQREVVRLLTRGRESGDLTRYLERNPLIQNDSSLGPEIRFNVPGSGTVQRLFPGSVVHAGRAARL